MMFLAIQHSNCVALPDLRSDRLPIVVCVQCDHNDATSFILDVHYDSSKRKEVDNLAEEAPVLVRLKAELSLFVVVEVDAIVVVWKVVECWEVDWIAQEALGFLVLLVPEVLRHRLVR